MTKRYKITIEEICTEEKLTAREWKAGAEPKTDENEDGRGYTPQVVEKREVERIIFIQNTNELDLKLVIKAINKID